MKNKSEMDWPEELLRGTIRQPSARFEEKLRRIPRQDVRGGFRWWAALRPIAVAASLMLGIFLFIKQGLVHPIPEPPVATESSGLDPEWIALFSLAEGVSEAEALADSDLRSAIEYYAFNP